MKRISANAVFAFPALTTYSCALKFIFSAFSHSLNRKQRLERVMGFAAVNTKGADNNTVIRFNHSPNIAKIMFSLDDPSFSCETMNSYFPPDRYIR